MRASAALWILLHTVAALRDQRDEIKRSACGVVEGAQKRKGLHWLQKCKCTKVDEVLTKPCGAESGERKFDVTRITTQTVVDPNNKGKRQEIAEGCKCAPAKEEEAAEEAAEEADPAKEEPEDEPEDSEEVAKSVCSRWGAIPRTGFFHKKGCKCEEDWTLSPECGDRRLLRKFNPKDKNVQNSDCRCITEKDQSKDKDLLGEAIEEPVATSSARETETEETPLTCVKPPPTGFQFGDTVRIEKKVHTGYKWEFAGIGLGAQYKDAGASGTVLQVVCSADNKKTEGRVCLRKGAKGSGSAGCWDPSNLVKLDP